MEKKTMNTEQRLEAKEKRKRIAVRIVALVLALAISYMLRDINLMAEGSKLMKRYLFEPFTNSSQQEIPTEEIDEPTETVGPTAAPTE